MKSVRFADVAATLMAPAVMLGGFAYWLMCERVRVVFLAVPWTILLIFLLWHDPTTFLLTGGTMYILLLIVYVAGIADERKKSQGSFIRAVDELATALGPSGAEILRNAPWHAVAERAEDVLSREAMEVLKLRKTGGSADCERAFARLDDHCSNFSFYDLSDFDPVTYLYEAESRIKKQKE